MKKFIITLHDGSEFWQFSPSLATLAILLENTGREVRAVEEVPADAVLDCGPAK